MKAICCCAARGSRNGATCVTVRAAERSTVTCALLTHALRSVQPLPRARVVAIALLKRKAPRLTAYPCSHKEAGHIDLSRKTRMYLHRHHVSNRLDASKSRWAGWVGFASSESPTLHFGIGCMFRLCPRIPLVEASQDWNNVHSDQNNMSQPLFVWQGKKNFRPDSHNNTSVVHWHTFSRSCCKIRPILLSSCMINRRRIRKVFRWSMSAVGLRTDYQTIQHRIDTQKSRSHEECSAH